MAYEIRRCHCGDKACCAGGIPVCHEGCCVSGADPDFVPGDNGVDTVRPMFEILPDMQCSGMCEEFNSGCMGQLHRASRTDSRAVARYVARVEAEFFEEFRRAYADLLPQDVMA